ncbi:MAG: response regulator [Ramlibacter sp.]|nr:response regulator [Ramlibacter sp.]
MTAVALPRLLIVDDEEANMRALCETIAACGYETTGALGGAHALAMLEASKFDLLLTDLRMPDIDGLELLRLATQRDPSLVAILMTGHGSIANAVEAMQAGALDYIIKPFKLSAALPVLARALKVRQLRLDNMALEAKLRRQMADLVAANSDLDAFSYSVSHDLRAPLQVIDGFSAVLASSHSSQLDAKGLHYLNRIRAGVGRMSELVNGLLRLSRLSRQPIERTAVDVDQLVRAVLLDLREEMGQVCGKVQIDRPLPPANADPQLLRQVFANLLANACKFSSQREAPRIDVGFDDSSGVCVYFVRDDGAGFDKAYASKMFEPFQRMHSADEFPGLGVGLSIVHRIVTRHGGKIWAESDVGQGACFYFTLEGSQQQ